MCTEVEVLRGAESVMCSSIEQLAGALGIDAALIDDDGTYAKYGDHCLCPVDFKKAARLSGMHLRPATDDEGFPFPEFIFSVEP
ncbi:hypothetical protein IMZ29_00980 [Achromobacter sp. GG226]|uniref:hypothetical protein n=1 Tax=Verticiella alkaliphila TaxID=2779529 RepID=UPI001C0CADF2|nr:hypothetical protein [Verticiella sp. GG226]MBU4609177.1 hypothetical protein [Verticiella sp. GG226]